MTPNPVKDALILRNISQRIEDDAVFDLWVKDDSQKMDRLLGTVRVKFVNTLESAQAAASVTPNEAAKHD